MESCEISRSDWLHSSRRLKDFMNDERKGPKKQVDVTIGMVTVWTWPRSEGLKNYVGSKDRYTGGQI